MSPGAAFCLGACLGVAASATLGLVLYRAVRGRLLDERFLAELNKHTFFVSGPTIAPPRFSPTSASDSTAPTIPPYFKEIP